MQDLLASATRVLSDDTLYRCLDKLLVHKRAFLSFLRQRWEVLFQARFDILLYDLTTTWIQKSALSGCTLTGLPVRRARAVGVTALSEWNGRP